MKKINLFSALDNKSLRIIEKKMKMILFEPDEYICRERESADCMFIITSGKIRVLKKGKGKSLIEISLLKSGSVDNNFTMC